MSDLRIVQLLDKENQPITPYTAASSVYVNINEEWTNVETQLGGMDINAIQDAQDNALESIEAQRVSSVQKIEDEGDSYRNDINTLSGTVKTLDEKVFPLTISTSITPNYSTLKDSYYYSVTEYGQLVTNTSINITKQANNASAVSIYNGTNASQTLTTDITWGRDIFKISCVKGSKTSSKTDTRYLCVYGAYTETLNASLLQNASVLNRILTNSAVFNVTINTTTTKPYIWVCVPEYLSISKITSAGFDVTMNNYVNIQVGSINYKAYRSKNPLQQSTWNLVIT